MPTLLFSRNGREILAYPLPDGAHGRSLRIGRSPANDLTIPDSEVSRFHALLEPGADGWRIQDQSRNGTFLNDRRLQEERLSDGDEIGIGPWVIVFQEENDRSETETVLKKVQGPERSFCGMIGESLSIREVFSMIARTGPTTATVLLIGETGSGKELAARAVHDLSTRSSRPFVAINCGAISPALIESELFGHERGAFTGAVARHAGAFEQASGGTLFLDEIGELPWELQPRLLRVLEDRRFRRVGGIQESSADVRVIAATHRELEKLVSEGKFREDLYFRLMAIPISIPPLRQRRSDIPLLAAHFMQTLQTGSRGEARKSLSPGAMATLVDHPWRGNVRELKNVITRSLLFARGEVIEREDLLFPPARSEPAVPSLEDAQKDAIVRALKDNGWNKKKAAASLGIAKSTLFVKIRQYGLRRDG